MNNVVDVTLNPAAVSDGFGSSVSNAGDVNGDGYADVIVGAPFNDAGGKRQDGHIFILVVQAWIISADVTLTGAAADDRLGFSVSTAGDVNGDGYSDLIVGSPNNDAGGINAGRAYLYLGGSNYR